MTKAENIWPQASIENTKIEFFDPTSKGFSGVKAELIQQKHEKKFVELLCDSLQKIL